MSVAVTTFLSGEGLSIVYQPVVDIRTGFIVGCEALARFASEPRRTPDLWFADAWAEGCGLELELTAIRKALADIPRLPADSYVAVNASAITLVSEELFDLLSTAPRGRVVVEVTEHSRIEDYAVVVIAIARLRTLGIRISVDDAGAGFASFQHVLHLRPDVIKLDRSLTTGIDENPVRAALASALVTFASSLGAHICAEGIEEVGELTTLQRLGVAYGQGYLLARPGPLPFTEIPKGLWFSPRAPERTSLLVSPMVLDPDRLDEVEETELVDSAPEEKFDRFTRVVAKLLGAPTTLISLVTGDRQFFKSTYGMPEAVAHLRETSLTHSFCQHTVTTGLPLIIENANEHPLVESNGATTDLGVTAYIGVPLVSNGHAIGSLCALDMNARRWTEEDLSILRDVAAMLEAKIELRHLRRRTRDDHEVFRAVFDETQSFMMLCDSRGHIVRVSRPFCALLGRDRATLEGALVSTLYPTEDAVGVFERQSALLSGQRQRVESVMHPITANGERLEVTARTSMVRGANGAARYFLTTLEPVVTARAKAQPSLRPSRIAAAS